MSVPDPAAREAAPLWQLLDQAARLVAGVRRGRSLTQLLPQVPSALRAGTQALAFEALRGLGTATALRRQLARRRPAPAVDATLLVALALLLPESAAGYAAFTVVDQACEAVRRGGAPRAVAFVNGCLRHFLRERDALLEAARVTPEGRWNHPDWWVQRLQADHPGHWEPVLAAAQVPAPMDLRVNTLRTSLQACLHDLAQAGLAAQFAGPAALRLPGSVPVQALAGHAEGLLSVQSLAAQLAAPLLLGELTDSGQGLRILDACAAPGGKTAHLLELAPRAEVLALERHAGRAERIHQNLDRLGLRARVRVADAAEVSSWWDGRPFHAVLLDAPCSASGITGRHPDVRWLRRRQDLARLATEQDRLLQALWPVLAPGGRMLYCTCSVFRQEGEQRVQHLLQGRADARRLPAPGHVLPGAVVAPQALPLRDGFFYALVQKQPS